MEESEQTHLVQRLRVALGALARQTVLVRSLAPLASEPVLSEAEHRLRQLCRGISETARELDANAPLLSDANLRRAVWCVACNSDLAKLMEKVLLEGARRGLVDRFDEYGALVNKPSWRMIEESLEAQRKKESLDHNRTRP